MFRTKIAEKIKTHILCSIFLFFENIAVYEIMWKNTVERDRPIVTTWRMRIAFWIPIAKNTRTLRICNIYSFSTATLVTRTRLGVT
jgi:hypothetical protein